MGFAYSLLGGLEKRTLILLLATDPLTLLFIDHYYGALVATYESFPMDVETIIRTLPEWKNVEGIHYEPLNGGYSNIIYKVFVGERVYALRINGKQNTFLGLANEDERDVVSLAAAQGVTPRVLECENKKDFLITEFVEGSTLSIEDSSDPAYLEKVIGLLKRIHGMPYAGKRVSTPFSLARGYLNGAESLGVSCPKELEGFLAEMEVFENERQQDAGYLSHYCHNDVFAHNIMVGDDGRIQMLDWELSGLSDIWFDLATISFSSGFDRETDEAMLAFYFGQADEGMHKTMRSMKTVCMIREIGWALLHTALNRRESREGDFTEFAFSVLDRLKRGLVSLV